MNEVLQNLSDAMADAVESAGRSVVRVEARRRLPATGIAWSADGLIITSNHGVERDDNITIVTPEGHKASAALVGRDPSTDLAVLRAEGVSLTVPAWGEPTALRVGHLVMALGRSGDRVMATMGIVSALESGDNFPTGMQIDHYLQTDVVMYPGFSGGPLVGADGKIYGLNSSALMRGVSLTIPVPTLRRVGQTLQAHGKMKRGFLGISVQPARLPKALAEQMGQESGLLIMSVEAKSPAEGILYMGDTIVELAGKRITDPDGLIASLGGDQVGKSAKVKIIRGGQVHELTVIVGERG